MVTFAVQAFKYMRTWLSLFGFKAWRVSLKVCFVIPSEVMVVFRLVGSIIFNTV